jgi:hypothetical protein
MKTFADLTELLAAAIPTAWSESTTCTWMLACTAG